MQLITRLSFTLFLLISTLFIVPQTAFSADDCGACDGSSCTITICEAIGACTFDPGILPWGNDCLPNEEVLADSCDDACGYFETPSSCLSDCSAIAPNCNFDGASGTCAIDGPITASPIALPSIPTLPVQTEQLNYVLMEPSPYATPDTQVCNYLGAVIITLIGIIGGLAVIMVLIGGIEYILGATSESRRSDAKDKLWNVVVGVVIALTAWLLLNTLDTDLVKGCYVLSALSPTVGVTIEPPNEQPTILVNPSIVTITVGSDYTEADKLTGVIATDPEDGNITSEIWVLSDEISTVSSGSYSILYHIEDSNGAIAENTRIVNVVD